jgi:hypothetical protein
MEQIKAFYASNKKSVNIGLILLGVILLFVYGKRIIWRIQNTFKLPGDISADGNTYVGLTSDEKQTAESVAKALYDDLHGAAWTGHEAAPYARAKVLSDKVFVAMYNIFNKKYGKGETLKDWIDKDLFIAIGSNSAGVQAQAVLDRIAALNLK